MRYNVVDTNVLVVANGRDTHAEPPCRLAAAKALLAVKNDRSLVLDTGREILGETAETSTRDLSPDLATTSSHGLWPVNI